MAGQGQEHLVERRLLHAHGVDGDALVAQGDQDVDGLVAALQRHRHQPGLGGHHCRVGGDPLDDRGGVVDPGGVHDGELQGGPADRRLQLVRRALGDLAAVVDDRDPVGELVGLVEVLGGEQHRAPVGHETPDGVPHLAAGARVEAGGRLVEEDQRWPGDQAGGQVEPAAHAAGERRDRLGRGLGEVELLEQRRGGRARRPAVDVLETGEEQEVLGRGQVLVDGGVLPGHAEQLADDVGLPAYVVTEDLGAAAVDGEQRGEHLEHGGLAGAVGTEDAEDLAAPYLEVDVVDGAVVTEVLDQALSQDRRCGVVHGSTVGGAGFTTVSPARAHLRPRESRPR